MNKATITKAVKEARVFLKRAEELMASDFEWLGITGSRRTAALRRQSMELTRALSEMRKP